jgi:hypothetical protein
MRRLTTLGLACALGACASDAPRPPAAPQLELETRALAAAQEQRFDYVRRVAALPADVAGALPVLASPVGLLPRTGGMADFDQPFNASDVILPGLPLHRLVLAALSPELAVVFTQSGGIAMRWQAVLVDRSSRRVCSYAGAPLALAAPAAADAGDPRARAAFDAALRRALADLRFGRADASRGVSSSCRGGAGDPATSQDDTVRRADRRAA